MIGFIFGENEFPKQILKKIKNKEKYLIIDLTNKNNFKKDKNSHQVSIGQFGKEFNLKNATPIYIRNKVAQTTKERLGQK